MLYVEPCGGLCNRMRVIASGLNLAKQYNEKIKVIWRLDKGLNCRFEDIFEPVLDEAWTDIFETSCRISPTILMMKKNALRNSLTVKVIYCAV